MTLETSAFETFGPAHSWKQLPVLKAGIRVPVSTWLHLPKISDIARLTDLWKFKLSVTSLDSLSDGFPQPPVSTFPLSLSLKNGETWAMGKANNFYMFTLAHG